MSRFVSLFVPLGIIATVVKGHGLLTYPLSKNGGSVAIPHESSTVHFSKASYGIIDKAFFQGDHAETPWTRPGEFSSVNARDLIPGHPQTLHPCGCNSGSVGFCAGVVDASGFGETTDGTSIIPPTWRMGSVQETAWNAWANHAGGHIYTMCKKTIFDGCRDDLLPANVHEATKEEQEAYLRCVWECFESNTLEWAKEEEDGWTQKVQFQDESCTYVSMDPLSKVGKDGHIWRFTPIPDSLQVTQGGEGKCMWDSVKSFSNPRAETNFRVSFGNEDVCDWGLHSHSPYDWNIFDKVIVPTDLEPGEYLLSWRWDAYMADQMWTNCADITVVDANSEISEKEETSASLEDCSTTPTQSPVAFPPPSPPVNSPEPTAFPTKQPVSPPTSSMDCPSGYSGLRPYDECTKYYHCHHGEVQGDPIACPGNTLFDSKRLYCNWASQVQCDSQPPPPPPTPPTGPPTSPPEPTAFPTKKPISPPSSTMDCPSGYSGLRPYDDCTKYYRCHQGEVKGDATACPYHTLFDKDLRYCNWAEQVQCNAPEGCFSNNYRDCNHPHFDTADASCHTIWLESGARNSCIALWGTCTNRENDCCEPAVCYKDDAIGGVAQCVPKSTQPSRSLRGSFTT